MIFEVPLPDGRIVYMCSSCSETSEICRVVWFDAKVFWSLWKDQDLDILSIENMKEYTKFPNPTPALQGTGEAFAQSAKHPVPVASFGNFGYTYANRVVLAGGRVRTMWLLVNGATAFPIECSPLDLKELEVAEKEKQLGLLVGSGRSFEFPPARPRSGEHLP